MARNYVYVAVVISGASVLALEILGTRIIAPFYGADIYLWSALISVTLAALSVGYVIGGRKADRNPNISWLSLMIGLAGLWIGLVPWLRTPVFGLAESMDLRLAVLLVATVLFFPPLMLLGTVSPYAIRLMASSMNVVGRTAGNLYAISTIAGVLAALLTGFILIPHVGVQLLTLMIGLVLIGTSAYGWSVRHRMKSMAVVLVIVIIGLFLILRAVPLEAANPENGVLAVEQSTYSEIRVVDHDDVRYLMIDGSSHSAADTATWRSQIPYVNVIDLAKGYFHQPGSLLVVGLGGGSIAKSFAQDGWRVDGVEIDPVVTRMAREYFGLREEEARVHTMDGRQFLKEYQGTYDMIVMDAYGSGFIPFHLITEETFRLVHSHLAAQGVVAVNLQCVGWHDEIVAAVAATLKSQFKQVVALPIAEPPDQLGNLVLLASDRSLELEHEPPIPTSRISAEYDRAHAWDNRFEPDTRGARVLTDDLNPIDIWSGRINSAERKMLHETIDRRGIAW